MYQTLDDIPVRHSVLRNTGLEIRLIRWWSN